MADNTPQIRNHAAEKLARDEIVMSMTARFVTDPGIGLVAKSAGFDILFVDLEHGAHNIETASRICIASQLAGVTPFVRVPSLEPEWISRVLDVGAMGVICPHIDSPEEAQQIVRWAKYPPLGKRAAAGRFPQENYRRIPTRESYESVNRATTVLAMIESEGGMRHLDKIAATEGIDILHIGVNDLANELGHAGEIDKPKVVVACLKVIEVARRNGKHVGLGGVAVKPEMLKQLIAAGARYVSLTSDIDLLCAAADERAAATRKLLAGLPGAGKAT